MPKKQTSKTKSTKKTKPASGVEDIKTQLVQWAHEGTKKSVEKINKFITETNRDNKELQAWAEMALGKAEYFYYNPNNNKEKREFLLARMINRRQDWLMEKIWKADAAKVELQELDLDRKAHQNVIKKLEDKKKKEYWQYNFSEDFYTTVKHRLQELEAEIDYETAWLEEARKLITLDKYKNIPPHIFEHLHLDSDGSNFWVDEPFSEDDNKDVCGDKNNNFSDLNKIEDIPF